VNQHAEWVGCVRVLRSCWMCQGSGRAGGLTIYHGCCHGPKPHEQCVKRSCFPSHSRRLLRYETAGRFESCQLQRRFDPSAALRLPKTSSALVRTGVQGCRAGLEVSGRGRSRSW
jgi:hypothetical protein